MRIFAFLICLLSAHPLWAQAVAPAGYFTGTYEMTGRGPGVDGATVLDWVYLQADGDGDAKLTLKSCRLGEGVLKLSANTSEGAAPLEGRFNDWTLFCQYQNDGDNYPRLTCYAVDDDDQAVPGLLTLWPAHWDKPAHADDCE